MRVIYEKDEEDEFLELILNDRDIDFIRDYKGVQKICESLFAGKGTLNLFIRRGDKCL